MGQRPSSSAAAAAAQRRAGVPAPVPVRAAPSPSLSSSGGMSAASTAPSNVEPTVFTDPITMKKHTYAAGDNVILVGDALNLAKSAGYASLAKLVSVDPNGTALMQFFTPGEPNQEGGIGIAAVQRAFALPNNARPLPFEFSEAGTQVLIRNSQIFTCERVSDVNAAGCDSCDPSGQLFGAETYADRLNQVFNMVTDLKGGPGATRYTLFACPATVIRAGQPVSVANTLCKTVIVATITGSTNTNRYSLISTMDPVAFRAAFLYTYGLPVDDASYYRAVQWSRIPEYQTITQQLQGERIACLDVDAGWLDQHIRELLSKGYEAKGISLLAGEAPGKRTQRLVSESQQRAFQQLAAST